MTRKFQSPPKNILQSLMKVTKLYRENVKKNGWEDVAEELGL